MALQRLDAGVTWKDLCSLNLSACAPASSLVRCRTPMPKVASITVVWLEAQALSGGCWLPAAPSAPACCPEEPWASSSCPSAASLLGGACACEPSGEGLRAGVWAVWLSAAADGGAGDAMLGVLWTPGSKEGGRGSLGGCKACGGVAAACASSRCSCSNRKHWRDWILRRRERSFCACTCFTCARLSS